MTNQIKEATAANEQWSSLILDTIKDIVFLLAVESENNYRFLFINPPFLAVTGLREEQILGKRVQEVLPETAHALVLGQYETAIRERRAVEWQETSVYPSGERIGEVRVIPYLDEQRRCTHLLGTVHDITALQRAQERSEQLFSLSAVLGQAVTTAQVAEAIIQAALPIFQARVGLVALLSEDGTRLVCEQIVGVPPAEAEAWRSFPADAPLPLADAVRERRLVVLLSEEAHDAAYPEMADKRTVAGTGALIAVPLLVGERCLGGIGLICPPERCRDAEQQTFLWTLAGQCALSLERARLYDRERSAESALRESEQRLRLALEGGNLASWHWDLATGAVDWPPKTRVLFGLPPDALIPPEHFLKLLHPDERQRVDAAMHRAIDGGPDYDVEYRIVWPDGSLHWIASRGRVYRDEHGQPTSMEGVVQNIDARRGAEETLRESEARYRTLVDATAQIVWTNTSAGKMNGSNAAWSEFTGQTEQEYQGYGWARAVHPDDAQPTVDAWQEAVAARRTFLFEHRLRRRDGVYRTFSVRAVPVPAADGTIREWVGVHTDVTERRALEEARENFQTQQRVFLRDILSSVTEGKLLLASGPTDLPAPLMPVGEPIPLTQERGLSELRLRIHQATKDAGHPEKRRQDLLTAANEAGMNAIVHAGGGSGRVLAGANGTLQVWVEDKGRGITVENLPKATLARGFSTKATLGHGLKMMLETADRLYLLTDPTGTTVVLEQEQDTPLPPWL
jgi:PAS domain S-box-containing protein